MHILTSFQLFSIYNFQNEADIDFTISSMIDVVMPVCFVEYKFGLKLG